MILAIETSGSVCSVALFEAGKIRIEHNNNTPLQHASFLGTYVEDILKKIEKDITLIAVAIGPGSFTGLRIGLSFAQGLCFGKSIPILGISNHQILASQVRDAEKEIYTLIDAHRNELYLAKHIHNPFYDIESHKIIKTGKLINEIPDNAHVVCPANLDIDDRSLKFAVTKVEFKASLVAKLADVLYKERGPDNIEQLQPMYIRSFAGIK